MTNYYLSTTGSDTNNGLSSGTAFATIGKGISSMSSGDILNVASGTYTPTGGTYQINKSGLTIQGVGQRPVFISTSGRTGLQFENSSYITIKNLEFKGDADNITYANALVAYNAGTSTINPVYSANGVFFRNGHHIAVIDCKVWKFPGAGIAFTNCDYMTADNCTVTDCTKYSAWGNQGITALHANNFDSNTTTYRNYFINNRSLRNVNLIPWATSVGGTGTINEGAGLMLDTTEDSSSNVAYTGKTLIANNYCGLNGNAGIQIFKAKNVDLRNNHCVENQQNITSGELLLHYSEDVSFKFGILEPRTVNQNYAQIKYTANCEFGFNNVLGFFTEDTSTSNTNLSKYGTT